MRFYYLEMGRRQKEARDKKREVESLKKERARAPHGGHAAKAAEHAAEPAQDEAAGAARAPSAVDGVKSEPSDE